MVWMELELPHQRKLVLQAGLGGGGGGGSGTLVKGGLGRINTSSNMYINTHGCTKSLPEYLEICVQIIHVQRTTTSYMYVCTFDVSPCLFKVVHVSEDFSALSFPQCG